MLTNLAFENADTGKKVEGSLALSKPDAVPEAGSYGAEWTFTPDDEKYLPVQGKSTAEADKANPLISKEPELEQIVYHPTRTLEDVNIPNGEESVQGIWRWKNDTLIPEVGSADYPAVFVPADQAAKIKAGKNRFTATFKKVKGATGYQISYSLKKNMSGKKTVTSKGIKKVVKKLKKGRKYYIQYRPVKKYKGKTYLGIMRSTTVKVR